MNFKRTFKKIHRFLWTQSFRILSPCQFQPSVCDFLLSACFSLVQISPSELQQLHPSQFVCRDKNKTWIRTQDCSSSLTWFGTHLSLQFHLMQYSPVSPVSPDAGLTCLSWPCPACLGAAAAPCWQRAAPPRTPAGLYGGF